MDPIQPPTQQSIEPPINIPDFQSKPNYFKTILFSILGVLLVSAIIYLYLQNQKFQKQVLNPPISPTIQAPSPSSQIVSPTPKTVSSISLPPDETAGWKTYTNNTYGFSIKYPIDWLIKCNEPTNEWLSADICNIATPNTKFDHGERISGAGIGIGIEKPNPNYNSLEEKVAFDEKNYQYKSVSKIINGTKGYLLTSNTNNAFVTKTTDYFIIISWFPLNKANPLSTTIDQILSTFKFVDQTSQISCTADSDCGVNICDCKADLEKNILVNDKLCERYCPGIPKCISSKCILIK